MADFASTFRSLRTQKGMSQQQLADLIGISKSALNMYERGERQPNFETLELIADYFNISIDYLLGKSTRILCPICNMQYDPLNDYENEWHAEFHKKYLSAQKKYGEILPPADINKLRRESIYQYMKYGPITAEERLAAFEDYLKYDYMQFLWKNDLSLDLEDFETYRKKEIGLASTKEALDQRDSSVYPMLVEKYGTLDDEQYHKPIKLTARDERDIKKDLESLKEKLANKEFGPAAFDGKDIPEDDTDLFLGQVELMLRRLKAKNKEKYTPDKYKK